MNTLTIPTDAAFVFTAASAVVALFQAALVLGAPWGHLTLGGRWPGALPLKGRLLAGLSILLLLAFSLIVQVRAGLILPQWQSLSRTAVWLVVGYCVLGSLANAFTPSRAERRLWLPVVMVMLVSSGIVAVA